MTGTVTSIVEQKGFGFIRATGSTARKETFFHCTSLVDGLEFGEQLLEQRVEYDVEETDRGTRAKNVRAAR